MVRIRIPAVSSASVPLLFRFCPGSAPVLPRNLCDADKRRKAVGLIRYSVHCARDLPTHRRDNSGDNSGEMVGGMELTGKFATAEGRYFGRYFATLGGEHVNGDISVKRLEVAVITGGQ